MKAEGEISSDRPEGGQHNAAPSLVVHSREDGGEGKPRLLMDARSAKVACGAQKAFAPIRRIGGRNGWYCANGLWRLRGFIDELLGGPGLRPGRRDPDQLVCGDVLDCWHVEAIEADRLLRLYARMKIPGRGWLQFEVEEREASSTIFQTATFEPAGLWGWLYWYSLYPLHQLIFAGMLRKIVRLAEAGDAGDSPSGQEE